MNKIKNWLYNLFLTRDTFPLSTPNLFYYILKLLPNNSYLIDFGCGNGEYYTKPNIIYLIKQKKIFILCIDIDKDAIEICKENTKSIQNQTKVICQDIVSYKDTIKYDYLIFTESAPLLSNQLIIDIILYSKQNLLKKNNKILFMNNINENKIMKFIKPLLKYITTIDFGRTLTFQDFNEIKNKIHCNYKSYLIKKITLYDILSYFYLYLLKFCLNNQDITQYLIIFD